MLIFTSLIKQDLTAFCSCFLVSKYIPSVNLVLLLNIRILSSTGVTMSRLLFVLLMYVMIDPVKKRMLINNCNCIFCGIFWIMR